MAILNPVLIAALDDLRERGGWLFPGHRRGTHLAPNSITIRLSDALPGDWTGHKLRHRCATRAYESTRDIYAVAAMLGHSQIETTRRYVKLPDDALSRVAAAAAL